MLSGMEKIFIGMLTMELELVKDSTSVAAGALLLMVAVGKYILDAFSLT